MKFWNIFRRKKKEKTPKEKTEKEEKEKLEEKQEESTDTKEEKQIENIVFYKFLGENGEMRQACIFYKDGTVENTSLEKGKEKLSDLMKQENLTEKDAESLVNKKFIYCLTGKSFEKRFNEFLGNSTPKGKENKKKKNKKDNKKKKNKKEEQKEGFWKRTWKKIKKHKVVASIAAIVSSVVLVAGSIFGVKALLHHEKKNDTKKEDNKKNESSIDNDKTIELGNGLNVSYGNGAYNDYNYTELVEATNNHFQQERMATEEQVLYDFNDTFASTYRDNIKDIKPALRYQEVTTLDLLYNDYSKFDISSLFNGDTITSDELESNYKRSFSELVGAHIIETKDNAIHMENLIASEEGKAFYQKYHTMFLNCKQATGYDLIEQVNHFNSEVLKDFDASSDKIPSYQLSVIPMVMATQAMYENLDIDMDMNSEIKYLFEESAISLASRHIDKVEYESTTYLEEDMTNPRYSQYCVAADKELAEDNMYITFDTKRDISQLNCYKEKTEATLEMENGYFTGEIIFHEEKQESVAQSNPIVEEQKSPQNVIEPINNDVNISDNTNSYIPEENLDWNIDPVEEESIPSYDEEIEDSDANHFYEYEEEIDEDLQDWINSANDQINQNNSDMNTVNDIPVNSDDFSGYDVEFFNPDEDGNLPDSVKDLTTEQTSASNTLPDPNGNHIDQSTTYTKDSNGQTIVEYEEPISESDIDTYIQALENYPSEETSYTYHK